MASVDVRKVFKRFGSVEVIHGIDVTIEDGSFVVLLGPSGCGKSTLLRMIAGLEEIGAGDIAIGGRVVNNVPPKDRDIAMVFQNYALYPHMSVFDNMAFSLRLAGVANAQMQQRVADAADILGLREYLQRYPRQLSGGQRQRVALARALAIEPRILLLDEPFGALDAKVRKELRAWLRALHDELKLTTIMVTHDQDEALALADHVAIMNEGRIEQVGNPGDLIERPSSPFVRDFLGGTDGEGI